MLVSLPVLAETGNTDLPTAQRNAETCIAIAEATHRTPPSNRSRAARTPGSSAPPAWSRPSTSRDLTSEVCTVLPADRKNAIYELAATQGMLTASLVTDAVERLKDDLNRQNKELQQMIEAHTPRGSSVAIAFTLLTAVPTTLRAGADLSALFKTNVSAQGIAYGDGARGLFATATVRRCPHKIAGLGSGYLGELDGMQYASLLSRVRALASGAEPLLKTVDAFIDSLRAGEADERSPLFNAARYLVPEVPIA